MATSGSPLPAYFRNPSEAILYAKEHKFALYLQGMHAFAKWQRELGDRFVARPVFTRKATYVRLVALDYQDNPSEEEPP